MSDVVVSVNETVTKVQVTETSVVVDVTETPVQVSVGTSGPQGAVGAGFPTGGTAGQVLAKNSATDYDTSWIDNYNTVSQQYVKNGAVALSKGQAVYVSGANGTNIIVSAASNVGETTSSKTLGLLFQSLAVNGFGWVITEGVLAGINTSAATAGDPVWLGVDGALIFGLVNKPSAPAHLVYLGVVTRAHATLGEVFVRVQNGFELQELHNVAISSPTANQVLSYDSVTGLWKNNAGSVSYAATSGTAVYASTAGSASSAGSALTAGTAFYSQTSGTAVYATTSGTAVYATSAGSASTAGTASFADQSGTATYSVTSGTATYATTAGVATSAGSATTAGTASYATLSGTAVSISGSITPSQVTGTAVITSDARLSDSRTPTAHAASHGSAGSDAVTLAQSQVTNLTSDLAGKAVLSGGNSFSGAQVIAPGATNIVGLRINTTASATSNPVELYDGTSTRRFAISEFGTTTIGASAALAARLGVYAGTATTIGHIIRGAASQSANLTEWQDSAGTILGRFSAGGSFLAAGYVQAGSSSASVLGQITAYAGSATVIGAVIRGAASQSANLQEWQNSAGTVLAKVDSAGAITGTVLTSNGYIRLSEQNSGGRLRMTKATAAVTNPGSGLAELYFRDGTNAGTLKLVVRAGAGGAETTILDNIPQ